MQQAVYASDILYIFALAFSKLSTAFLFLRLTPGRGHVLAIWSTICLSIAWTIISIFLIAFRCHPSHPWTDTIFVSECTSIVRPDSPPRSLHSTPRTDNGSITVR